jgi:Flp pilus assembly CpaE family ATPase
VSARLRVVLALTTTDEGLLEGVLFGSERIEIVGSASSGPELLELTRRSSGEVVLLSADLQALDADTVARTRAQGLRVVGVATDATSEQQLRRLGVDALAETDVEADLFLAALETEDVQAVEQAPARSLHAHEQDEGLGSFVAIVGGGAGAGASECAASLAALCDARWQTCLLELDGRGGLALRLGLDPHDGSLLGLARALRARERELDALLARWLVGGEGGWPAILLAPPDPEQTLGEVAQPGIVAAAIDALRRSYPLVVGDLGEELSEHSAERQRLINREALTRADAVVLVLGARPEQLRRGLFQLRLVLDELELPPERLRVAVNGTGGPGSAPPAELTAGVNRELGERGLLVDAWLPFDERSLKAALRTGTPLALARRRSRYGAALDGLVQTLFVSSAPTVVARKTRLRTPMLAGKTAGLLEEVSLPWRH